MEKNQTLVPMAKTFAVRIIRLCVAIQDSGKRFVLANQLLRAGTSIGANIHEANYASSRADFINKFQIALKECYETSYWLEVFRDAEVISESDYRVLSTDCNKIRKMLTASIRTAKSHLIPPKKREADCTATGKETAERQ